MLNLNVSMKNLVGHIKTIDTDEDLGSCIPCKKGSDFFIITCGHVLYKKDWTNLLRPINEIKVVVNDVEYFFEKLIGDSDKAEKTDLAILKIVVAHTDTPLPFLQVDFFNVQNEMSLRESKLCIFPQSDQSGALVKIVTDNFVRDRDSTFTVEVAKGTFHDINSGSGGAEHYKGISGSGLFLEHNGKIYLQGILKAIPKNTISEPIVLVNSKALNTFWNDITITGEVSKENPTFHHNSPLNSAEKADVLRDTFSKTIVNKNFSAFICAPSEKSSTKQSNDIFNNLTAKFKLANILYSVGGGRGKIVDDDSFPNLNEQKLIRSGECDALVIIADDYSTFSQLALLSQTIYQAKEHLISMYICYKDEVIDSEKFMEIGSFRFAEDIVRAKVFRFSTFNDHNIDEIVRKISTQRLLTENPS
ncbi:MAG: hypothetical protein ACJAS1_006883 [Oleiphilaceae bacterium]